MAFGLIRLTDILEMDKEQVEIVGDIGRAVSHYARSWQGFNQVHCTLESQQALHDELTTQSWHFRARAVQLHE